MNPRVCLPDIISYTTVAWKEDADDPGTESAEKSLTNTFTILPQGENYKQLPQQCMSSPIPRTNKRSLVARRQAPSLRLTMAGEQHPYWGHKRDPPIGSCTNNTGSQMAGDRATAAAILGTTLSQEGPEDLQTPKIMFNEGSTPEFDQFDDFMESICLDHSESSVPQQPSMALLSNPGGGSAMPSAESTNNAAPCSPSLKVVDFLLKLDNDQLADIAGSDGLLQLDPGSITPGDFNNIGNSTEFEDIFTTKESEGAKNSEQNLANLLLASELPSNCLDSNMRNTWNLMPSVLSPDVTPAIPPTKSIPQLTGPSFPQTDVRNHSRVAQSASGKHIQTVVSFPKSPENFTNVTTNPLDPNTEYKTLFCVQQATASTDTGQHKINVSIPKTFLETAILPPVTPLVPQKRKIVQDNIPPNLKLRKVTLINSKQTGITTVKMNNSSLSTDSKQIKGEMPDVVHQLANIQSIPGPSTQPLVNVIPSASYGSDEHNLIVPDVVHTIDRTDTDSDDNGLMIDNYTVLPYSRLPSKQQKEIDAEKYRRHVAANNEASKRCRQKKKEAKLQLVEELHFLETRNQELQAQMKNLDKKKTNLFQYLKEAMKVIK